MKSVVLITVLSAAWGVNLPAAEEFVLPRMPAEDRDLAARFADPPPSARLLRILHAQSDDPVQQNSILSQLAAQGFGGFAGNVAFKGYVEDPTKWPPFERGVKLAKDAGMTLWLYDECGYPSGSAGDLTLRGHPEWAARGLLVAETNLCGGVVSLALPPGSLVSAVALPRASGRILLDKAVDLSSRISQGRLNWQAPEGNWYVAAMTDDLIYEGTHAAISLAYKKPCINLLMPEPTARFLEVTHERYAEHLGRDLGKYFASTFTDEPSLQNYWFRPMPYRVLPWSDNLPGAFKQRHGVELQPLLPALLTDAGPQGAAARYMFWDTWAELVSENYVGQIQRWCQKHNIASGGHLLMEESLVSHVSFYGDFFRCIRRMDAPGIDCLTSLPEQVHWDIARLVRSVADLQEHSLVMCEVSDHSQRYRREGDTRPVITVTEDQIRGTCHRLLWGGINTLTSYYRFKDLDDDQLRRLNTEIGRCSTMLAGGHTVCDIAVLYPVESVWPEFTPGKRGATGEPVANRIEHVFDSVGASLYQANREFNYIDARALVEAKSGQGCLTHGDLRWQVLLLPMCDTLPLEAWERIHDFWRKGGAVIAVGARPANTEREFPSAAVQQMADAIFGKGDAPVFTSNKAGGVGILLPVGMAALVPQMVDSVLGRDAWTSDVDGPIRITHRRVDGHDVYFVMNDSSENWSGEIHFNGEGVAEQWNPVTGEMSSLKNGTRIPLNLGAYRAMLFRVDEIAEPQRLAGQPYSSVGLKCNPLPVVEPKVGHGTFVTSEMKGDGEKGWCAAARLTKGDVDTHLFMGFNYAGILNLTARAGLVVDSAVPDGQTTPAEMLVFVETKNGARYLASTGRFLNEPGEKRAYVMFSQFRPFGDKEGLKGALDLSQVTTVRVGWGGYFGREGEQISLTVKPPQSFAVNKK